MGKLSLLAWVGIALFTFGCNNGGSGTGTLIGLPCTNSAMCGPVGICITTQKDGECSLPCQVSGGLGECPLGTYCDREDLKSDVEPKSQMTLCLPSCNADNDCRSGYKCKGVSDGPGKVCAPK
jgi:hypothetical protein